MTVKGFQLRWTFNIVWWLAITVLTASPLFAGERYDHEIDRDYYIPSRFLLGVFEYSWIENGFGGVYQHISYNKKNTKLNEDNLAGIAERLSAGWPILGPTLALRVDLAGQIVSGANPDSIKFFGADTLYEAVVFPSGEIAESDSYRWMWGLRYIHRQGFNIQVREALQDTAQENLNSNGDQGQVEPSDVKTDTKRLLVRFNENRISPLTAILWDIPEGFIHLQAGANLVYYNNDPDNHVGARFSLRLLGFSAAVGYTLQPRRYPIAIPVNVLLRLPLDEDDVTSTRRRFDIKDLDESFFDRQVFFESGVYYTGLPNLRCGLRTVYRSAIIRPQRRQTVKSKDSVEFVLVLGYIF